MEPRSAWVARKLLTGERGSPDVFALFSRESRERRKVFSRIHDAMAWGPCESRSGPGSTRARAASFLPDLSTLIRRLQVITLLDAPCGDFNWAGPLADAVEHYIGVDIVPALIATNRASHASPRRTFLCRDIVRQHLPAADLVICRDALVHLTTAEIFAALANLRRTGAKYLIATTFVGDRANEEIATGEWRPLNLQRPPFSLPAPFELVDERCPHPGMEDKRFGVWRLAELPS